jgi:hypothetical protein
MQKGVPKGGNMAKVPTRKVGYSAVAGALTIILVWAVEEFGDTKLPAEVASSITALLTAITGYFVPES